MLFVVGVLSIISGVILWMILESKLSPAWQDGWRLLVGMAFCIFLMTIVIGRTFSALGFKVSDSDHQYPCYQTPRGLECD